ncbi:MAG: hypothetical protein FWE70_02455 [Oscillospiraceae bacterium]|nr:hypothetical protein [Oscillospiraceae bacterium]
MRNAIIAMRKTILMMMVFSLMLSLPAACGGEGGEGPSGGSAASVSPSVGNGGDPTDSASQDDGYVKSSQLIPLEDAKRIVHGSLEVSVDGKTNEPNLDKPTASLPGSSTVYGGDVFLVLSVIVNHNERYIAGVKRDLDAGIFDYETVEGVGDWAAFIEIIGKSLHIGYKDIFLDISIAGLKSVGIAEEDIDGIFMELGRLACARYDALRQ